jgi:hypothetical protein
MKRERIDRAIVPNIHQISLEKAKRFSMNHRANVMLRQRYFNKQRFEEYLCNREAPQPLEYLDEFLDEEVEYPDLPLDGSELYVSLMHQCPSLVCLGVIEHMPLNNYLCTQAACPVKLYNFPYYAEIEEIVEKLRKSYIDHKKTVCPDVPLPIVKDGALGIFCESCAYCSNF